MLRLALAFAVLLAPTDATAQPPAAASRQLTTARARTGEQVFILFNYVSPEKRARFEAFSAKFDLVMDQVVEADPAFRAIRSKMRVLYPAAAARDGRWVYVYLIDPVVPDVDYGMDSLIRRVLTRDETNAMMREYYSILESKERPAECGNHDNLALVQKY